MSSYLLFGILRDFVSKGIDQLFVFRLEMLLHHWIALKIEWFISEETKWNDKHVERSTQRLAQVKWIILYPIRCAASVEVESKQ